MGIGKTRLGYRQGFLLPMALVLLAILLLLEVGLFSLQQRATQSALGEESRLALLLGTEEIDGHLRDALANRRDSAFVSLSSDFDYSLPNSRLRLSARWGGSTSQAGKSANNPVAGGWGDYDKIFGNSGPELAFAGNASLHDGKTTVSPGHTLLDLRSSASDEGGGTLSSYSHLFPYGIYAPLGKVIANRVGSFTNPTYDQGPPGKAGDEEEPPLASGRPVDILAGSQLTVTESYRVGRAMSVNGPIKIPLKADGSGAVPMGGFPIQPPLGDAYLHDLQALAQRVAAGSTDKTEFLDDELFTVDHLRQIFDGNVTNLISIFGVGQACKVPFFPLPGMQNDAPLLIVFYIMCPYPADFTGVAGKDEGSERMGEIGTEIHEKEAEVAELQKKIDEERAKEKPDKKKIDGWKGEASDLADEIDNLKKEAQDIAREKDEQKADIAAQLSQAKIPQNASEDGEMRTKGWAYLFVMGRLFDIVIDLISGHNPFQHIFAPTRVVHLGQQNPGWSWPDGNIDMKAVLSVPPGRSLKIKKPQVTVHGDVHLQKGSVLYVEGNLTIERPTTWVDFKGVTPSSSRTIAYPHGRLLMEPGSSVVVTGDLIVNGGSYEEGSISVVSGYGANKGITQLISAGGDVKLRYGLTPGVEMGDLVDALGKDRPALKTFNEYFFRPLVLELGPQVSKLPDIGPWQSRKCYFADYSTTFEFIPALEIFGLGGPWPIPLPFDNCLKKVFKYVSLAYSTELNAFLGENFYTMSPFWFFGRGVSPVLFKCRPELLENAFNGLRWDKIALDAFHKQLEKFIEDTLPDYAIGVFENIIAEVITHALESLIPFKPPECGEKEDHEAESIRKKAEEFLREALKDFGKTVSSSLEQVLLRIKNDIYKKLDGDDERFSALRELPGVAVVAGDEILIGTGGTARYAMGLFVAQRNIKITCDKTIGTLIALEGDVEVEEFLHYPYFDRASLYNPHKYGTADIFESVFDLDITAGALGGDVNQVFPRRLAEGWR
jgi:hypothetical protein